MPKLGQHFLRNSSAVTLIVAALELASNDIVIEIGPGHGELTIQTVGEDREIIAIEKDETLANGLEARTGIANNPHVRIVRGDALDVLPGLVTELSTRPGFRYKLTGNIPYYITGHLLRTISELEQQPERSVFTIQKEVAERIIAGPPRATRLSASVQYWAEPKILKILPPGDFSPPPKVSSAILLLSRRPFPVMNEASRYYDAVRTTFAQPRKTVLNNLAGKNHTTIQGQTERTKEELFRQLQTAGIDPEGRPQDLTTEDIAKIAELFF